VISDKNLIYWADLVDSRVETYRLPTELLGKVARELLAARAVIAAARHLVTEVVGDPATEDALDVYDEVVQ
jgi:hypothetical protein